jgi:4-amino-4-deoxy-L-arabinose transferase-like glycosyltransferase
MKRFWPQEDAWPSFWKIMVLAAFIAVVFQGSRGLYETTEGRYAECAREMLASGNFLEPTLDFQPHWTKPPMTYWAIETGIALLGRNEWGARAYLVVAFCLTVAAIYSMAGLVWGREVAPYSAFVYMTSFLPVLAANAVSPDTLLTLWEALAMLGFWAGIRSQKRYYFVLMWLFLGAGFLTKGPPGLIPLLSILPIYGLMKRKSSGLPSVVPISGILPFIGVAFGWYLYEAWLHPGLLSYWIKHEVAGHLLTNEYARNTKWYKAILFYWPILTFGALPWIGVLLLKCKYFPWSGRNWFHLDYWSERIEWSFVGLSISLPFIVFSLSKSKLPLYILPLFIPISLAMGRSLHWLVLNQKIRLSVLKWVTLFTLILIVAGKGVVANIPYSKDMRQLAGKITPEIASFPHKHLYFVGEGSLYGLEFYLNSLFTRVSLTDSAQSSTMPVSRLSEALLADYASGIVSFILVRNEDLFKLREIIAGMGGERRVERENQKIEGLFVGESQRYIKKLDDHRALICWRSGNETRN